ncbi:muts domain V-domain-containing protein [Lasiosphaeria miniovina]|uniref:DNA mismatch repair protein n=1 Tax=Lasiosphaeria miniovina TaxID=1954250 RepID=A0AA40BGS4_9PEZI|nr:muts domain V-domain-containing protein [Lasiosphaeria miniovina]KAK0733944.1 muts domain V-domain-containing protein [Lasiosphaeria miniovina]
MAGSSKPPEKRQASLTSFFTPKTVNGLTQRLQSSPARPKPQDSDLVPAAKTSPVPESSRKRPLQENTDKGNETPDRAKKRTKAGSAAGVIRAGDDTPSKPAAKASTTACASTAELPNPSGRTERYIYDAAAAATARSSGVRHESDEDGDQNAATRREKEALHKKFVKKLGHPDSMAMIRRRNFQADADTAAVQGEDGEADDDADEEEPAPPSKTKKKGAKTGKLTPMEMQFLEIKRKHMDTLLIVEVGYKFRFFGEDARIAAKELSIMCIPGKFRYDEQDPSEAHIDRFASASIPVHRLSVHAKRLVAAGHKVGVVRQIETAALKKAGDNRNAPFVRKLTSVYTKGTYVDETGELDQTSENTGAPSGGYLLCLTESPAKGSGTDEKVDVGIVAVQPATGDIIYDNFEDGFMRRDIETRLLHISPCEFLIVGELTKATDKLVQHLSGSRTNVFGDRSRVERIPKSKTMATEASSHVTQFYAGKMKNNDERTAALLDKVLKLPEAVTICLSAMIKHLTEYGLEHIFDLTKYFQSFSTRQHMLINGTTLESLEVYRNATDHSEKGSLLWALDKTQTRFGQRQLRKWIGRPLLDQKRVEERVAAVEELLESQSTSKVDKLIGMLKSIKADLERSLIRIYYGKCTRPELLSTLKTLQKVSMEFARVKSPADTGFRSPLISEAICSLPAIGDILTSYLDKINPEAAKKDDKYTFFRDEEETDDITNHKLGIAAVEQDLDAHLKDAAAKLSRKTPITYVTVAGIEYLIEVLNSDLKRVPASWAKISGTKKVSRFHTPQVMSWISERDQHREALAAACDAAFKDLLQSIAAEYQPFRDAIASLATLDCLLSFAQVAALPGYSKPTFLPDSAPPTITIAQGRHPIAEHTLPNGYIPFTTSLTAPAPLAHLITGPNMGGKSSYVRAVALLVLLAQVGSFVPAAAMTLTLADAIHTRMGARDNLFAGESTFMVEVSETAAILRSATPRSLVVLDELGRGTSTHDGAAIAHAVLEHVVRETKCLTLFITHYQNLARVADGLGDGRIKCVHMSFTAQRRGSADEKNTKKPIADSKTGDMDSGDDNDDDEITFLYEVAEGVAHRSYGLNVARLARIPRKVLAVAALKSCQLEDEMRARRLRGAAKLLEDVLRDGPDQLDHLISSLEQL